MIYPRFRRSPGCRWVCNRFRWDFSSAGSEGSVSMPRMIDANEARSRSSGRTSTRTQRRSTQFSKKLPGII